MNSKHAFDETKINWQPLPDVDHVWLSILNIDDTAKIVDVLFKFSAHEKIKLHRHTANFNTLVLQGEHRIYNADGELPDIEPHREGGGEENVIILFSLRPYNNDPIYELLDENHEIEGTMTFDDLKEMHEATG